MTTLTSTPRADGFRMPAEWEQHQQTWMVWPQRPDNWRLGGKPAQAAFTAVAKAIAGLLHNKQNWLQALLCLKE